MMTPQCNIRFLTEADAAGLPSYITPQRAGRTIVNLNPPLAPVQGK